MVSALKEDLFSVGLTGELGCLVKQWKHEQRRRSEGQEEKEGDLTDIPLNIPIC
jgi:hypothetical protein